MPLDHLAALADAQERFATGLAQADPDAPVAPCAPWRVADLALHLGGVHWWASAMCLGVDLDASEPGRPRDTASLVAFYRWAAAHLRTTLAEVDPGARALTLDGPGPAGFWRRRQLHETLVHLWDLDTAAGTDLSTAPDDAWSDAVAEVVDTMTPRQVRLGRIPSLPHAVDLVAPDASWRMGPEGSAVVAVHGSPRDLALLVWGRIGPHDRSLQITGQETALDETLQLPLTP